MKLSRLKVKSVFQHGVGTSWGCVVRRIFVALILLIAVSGCSIPATNAPVPAADSVSQEATSDIDVKKLFLQTALADSNYDRLTLLKESGLTEREFRVLVVQHFDQEIPSREFFEPQLGDLSRDDLVVLFAQYGLYATPVAGVRATSEELNGSFYELARDTSNLVPGAAIKVKYYLDFRQPEGAQASPSPGETAAQVDVPRGKQEILRADMTSRGFLAHVMDSKLAYWKLCLASDCSWGSRISADDAEFLIDIPVELRQSENWWFGISTLTCFGTFGPDEVQHPCPYAEARVGDDWDFSDTSEPSPAPTQTQTPTPAPSPTATATQTPTPTPTAPSYIYQPLNLQVVAPDGMSVTVTELFLTPKSGSTQLTVAYSMTNNTSDKEIVEGSFALFYDDGSKLNQYGFFNNLFPGDSSNRRYVFEWTGSKKALLIEYEADFFASKPSQAGLKWKAPE